MDCGSLVPDAEQIRFRNDNDLPRLVRDAQGRMWLFFRHQQPTAGDGSYYRPGWEVYATFYQGSSWATPFVLPYSSGRLNMPLALDGSAEETLWMAWLTDHRSLHQVYPDSGTLQEDVVVGRLELSGQVRAAQLETYQVLDEPIKPLHADEPGDLSRIRAYRIEAAGKSYRLSGETCTDIPITPATGPWTVLYMRPTATPWTLPHWTFWRLRTTTLENMCGGRHRSRSSASTSLAPSSPVGIRAQSGFPQWP